MKKFTKSLISVALALVMLFTVVTVGAFAVSSKVATNKASLSGDENLGDIIEFGSYPQTKVTDETILLALNNLTLNWKSYGYYSGTGGVVGADKEHYGSMTSGDWMKYADVTYNGNKYRAVTFSVYRPSHTIYKPNTEVTTSGNNEQARNDYYINTVYWFKYEPIKWRVLNPETGLVVSEKLLDSQPFNNTEYLNDGVYYSDALFKNYANDYATSSIRKWLNDDFYNTAFARNEKSQIVKTKLDDVSATDNVFLLSIDDVTKEAYGFSSTIATNDGSRRAYATDYSNCQGLDTAAKYTSNWNTFWWLRSSSSMSMSARAVDGNGNASLGQNVDTTFYGTRPAVCLTKDVITITITNSNNTYTDVVSDVSSKTHTFVEIENGTYSVTVSRSNYATKKYTVEVTSKQITLDCELSLLGDVNFDGKITVTDYVKVLQHAKGISTLEGYAFACGDVDENDKITVTDYVKILQHAKGTEYLW